MTKCNIKDKIKIIVVKLQMISGADSYKELAEILGTNENTFSSWRNQSKEIPIDNLVDFCNTFNISLDYLLRDEKYNNNFSEPEKTLKIKYIRELDAHELLHEQIKSQQHIYIANNIFNKPHDQQSLFCCSVKNNELPYSAPENSLLYIDKSNKNINEYPELYVVIINNEVKIKKMYKNIKSGYSIISEHKDVSGIDLKQDEVKIIGKIIGVTKWLD
jgi:SOS-response transcriptional repressor LexA